MKRVLITGAGSYIGTSFQKYLLQWADQYFVDTVDMMGDSWKKKDFSNYDVVYHVAGIAHSDIGNATEEVKALYYKVNTDLTIETAAKAKAEGVKQFIFMSSAIVYGDSAPIGKTKIITKDTIPTPGNFYGDSKLKAEKGILPLGDSNFKVVVLRPPMIYGKGSKGNYPLLAKYACKFPVFPDVENCRSMLYIENLLEFVRLIIENNESGIFFPQNEEYVKTSVLVKEIAKVHGKRVFLTRIFNPFIHLMSKRVKLLNKVFGNLCYAKELSVYKGKYCRTNFEQSIKETEAL